MEKMLLKFPVVVEGKYDKIKLTSLIASPVVTLDGFAIFNNKEKMNHIKKLADTGGLIILTDSDKAGNFIRGKLKGYLEGITLYNVYTPQTEGREKRKKISSKEGFLGVEGIDAEILKKLLKEFEIDTNTEKRESIDKTCFYNDGYSGKPDSAARRAMLCTELNLPLNLSCNALLEAVNLLYGAEEYARATEKIMRREECKKNVPPSTP